MKQYPTDAAPSANTPTATSYGKKIFFMGLICCVLMFGLLAVLLIAYGRESNNQNVTSGIKHDWGSRLTIHFPSVAYGISSCTSDAATNYNCDIDVTTKKLHRGIYEVEVFTANVKVTGKLSRGSIPTFGNKAIIKLPINSKRIVRLDPLELCGRNIDWETYDNGVYAEIDVYDLPEVMKFAINMDVRGSEALDIDPIGKNWIVTISGEAQNPSFFGITLPDERTVNKGQFSATWQNVDSNSYSYYHDSIGVRFLVGVNGYAKTERSMKYSIIIILLTFTSVLFIEIMKKQPIPLFNYFLIGAALIIFYTLLLSFAEIFTFGVAYLIATALTVGLVTLYMWKWLQSKTLGLSIGAVLLLIYLFCYILLCLSTYALLFGSLLLFITLAAMMYASLTLKRA